MTQHANLIFGIRAPILGLALLSCACTGASNGSAGSGSGSAPAARAVVLEEHEPAVSKSAVTEATSTAKVPDRFREYASTTVGQGRVCVVGAVDDEDASGERPVVMLKERADGPIAWTQQLSGLEGMYQTRATHCANSGTHLYVLLQSDTSASQSLSQTQLSIAKLAETGGAAPAEYVAVPGTLDKAFSAWVTPEAGNFRIEEKAIHLQARYFLLEDRNTEKSVEINLDLDLKPLSPTST